MPRSGDDTRRQILDVSRELFLARNSPAPAPRIADRMDFTKAALYYHYRTKEDPRGRARTADGGQRDGLDEHEDGDRHALLTHYLDDVLWSIERRWASSPTTRRS